jgi:predicted  nucleic acid-binding Zn-ribbon protein
MNALVPLVRNRRIDDRQAFAEIAGHLVWKLETSAATIQGLRVQVRALKQDNLQLQQRGEDQDQLIDNLERDNTQLRGQLHQLATRMETSLEQNRKLQEELNNSNGKIKVLEKQVEQLKEEEGNLSNLFEFLRKQIEGAVKEIFCPS